MPRILVIDDDASICRMITDMLSKKRSQLVGEGLLLVDAVSSADEALSLIEEKDYNLIITDINMPGTSGWELIDKIREKKAEQAPLFLAISGVYSKDMQMLAVSKHISWLPKPFDLIDIIQRVKVLLNSNSENKAMLDAMKEVKRDYDNFSSHVNNIIKPKG